MVEDEGEIGAQASFLRFEWENKKYYKENEVLVGS